MSADARCDETRDLLPELALGIADGADRARILAHVAECADCRRELERQAAIADGLLLLAPEHEPPPGFELAVLREIEPSQPVRRRRAFLPRLAFVGAVAAAVAITAGAMLVGFRDDRRLAEHYRATLAQAEGTYFGAVPLTDPAGRPGGVLFAYRGAPSWILVTVEPEHRAAVVRAELVARDGRRIPIPGFALASGVWGGSAPLDLRDLAAVHLVDADGRSVLVATF
jgi:Putative zinc-finger